MNGHLEVVKILLGHGADPGANIGTENNFCQETPFIFAVKKEYFDIVREILKVSKNVLTITDGWDTPPWKLAKSNEMRDILAQAST